MSYYPYTSYLLNELHQFFPDILYRPERFQNVSDLLNYVIDVARQNPYDRIRGEYERSRSSRTNLGSSRSSYRPPQTPQPSSHLPRTRAPFRHAEEEQLPPEVSVLNVPIYSAPVNLTSSLLSAAPVRRPQAAEQIVTSFINELLRPSYQSTDLTSLESFLNSSVVVRPTEEQIQRATIVISSFNPPPYDNCAICQDAMEEGQMVRILSDCTHRFHQECIDTWFQSHVTCPTCRHDIREVVPINNN